MNRRSLLRLAMVPLAAVLTQALGNGNAEAADKLKAVASFSILGDMLHQVGGDRVEVITLVGPNGDAHVYAPTPTDAKHLSEAKLLVINGLYQVPIRRTHRRRTRRPPAWSRRALFASIGSDH